MRQAAAGPFGYAGLGNTLDQWREMARRADFPYRASLGELESGRGTKIAPSGSDCGADLRETKREAQNQIREMVPLA